MTFVNTFILGPAKSATTTIANWLSQHRDAIVLDTKESNFFSTNEYARGSDWYFNKHFAGRYYNQSVVVDATTMHLVVPYVPQRIRESCESPKFIVILRNPIERALSHWNMQRNYRPGYTFDNFSDAMSDNYNSLSYKKFSTERERMASFDGMYESYEPTFIEQGLYYNNCIRYKELFGEDNIMFIDIGCIESNPLLVMADMCEFLGIDNIDIIPVSKNISPEYSRPSMFDMYSSIKVVKKIIDNVFIPDAVKFRSEFGIDVVSLWGYDKL